MSLLAKCPCGKTPTKISVQEGFNPKYAWATPDCCGEWSVEFRTEYLHLDRPEIQPLADAAWNEAPRKETGKDEE